MELADSSDDPIPWELLFFHAEINAAMGLQAIVFLELIE